MKSGLAAASRWYSGVVNSFDRSVAVNRVRTDMWSETLRVCVNSSGSFAVFWMADSPKKMVVVLATKSLKSCFTLGEA